MESIRETKVPQRLTIEEQPRQLEHLSCFEGTIRSFLTKETLANLIPNTAKVPPGMVCRSESPVPFVVGYYVGCSRNHWTMVWDKRSYKEQDGQIIERLDRAGRGSFFAIMRGNLVVEVRSDGIPSLEIEVLVVPEVFDEEGVLQELAILLGVPVTRRFRAVYAPENS